MYVIFLKKKKKADSIKYDKLQALMIVSLSRDSIVLCLCNILS